MTVQMTMEAGSSFPMWCHLEQDVLQQLLCIIIGVESPSHQSQQKTLKCATPSLKRITSGSKNLNCQQQPREQIT